MDQARASLNAGTPHPSVSDVHSRRTFDQSAPALVASSLTASRVLFSSLTVNRRASLRGF